MIRHVIIIFLFFTPILWKGSSEAFSQNIKGGIIAGMNASQVDGDKLAGFNKFGINAGAIAIVPIKGKISASLEILYSEKGSQSNNSNWVDFGFHYKLKLNYVDVPVLINYQDKEKVSFGTGISVNTLVKFREYNDDIEQPSSDSLNIYSKRAFDWVISGTYLMGKHFAINLRYSYSIIPIADRTVLGTIRKQWHNVVGVRVMYFF